jgi:circadian clock protein KaiC
MPPQYEHPDGAAPSGIEGLDAILRGGFPRGEVHQLEGGPGTGKTTLGLHYLMAGRAAGERGLYVTLAQTKRGLERIACSHGWSLEGIVVHELSPGGMAERMAGRQTVLHTAQVELDELTRDLCKVVEQIQPQRLVFDSMDVIGLLAGNASQYRLEVVALRQFLLDRDCTALFIGDAPQDGSINRRVNADFYNLATLVLELEQSSPEYGEVKRRMRVIKARGVPVSGGYHNFRVQHGGLVVYPRLGPPPQDEYSQFRPIRSGIEPLDELLGGGLEQGTTCLMVGAPGTGKSTLAAVHVRAAAAEGINSSIFLFDERPETFKARAKGLKIDLEPHVASGRVSIVQLDPADLSAGEFAQKVRSSVIDDKSRLVVIDSLMGYFSAMGNSEMLIPQIHELLTFLSRNGVLTMLLASQQGFMSIGAASSVDVSYLSDTVVVLRMFELQGHVRRCLAAIKKRQGEHQTSIRELFIDPKGVRLAREPLHDLRKILSGDPEPTVDGE